MTHRHTYYWIVATDEFGKTFLIFGGNTESQAREQGLEMLPSTDFRVVPLHSRNSAMASQEWKGGRLKQTHDLHASTQRVGHERSLTRRNTALRRRRYGR